MVSIYNPVQLVKICLKPVVLTASGHGQWMPVDLSLPAPYQKALTLACEEHLRTCLSEADGNDIIELSTSAFCFELEKSMPYYWIVEARILRPSDVADKLLKDLEAAAYSFLFHATQRQEQDLISSLSKPLELNSPESFVDSMEENLETFLKKYGNTSVSTSLTVDFPANLGGSSALQSFKIDKILPPPPAAPEQFPQSYEVLVQASGTHVDNNWAFFRKLKSISNQSKTTALKLISEDSLLLEDVSKAAHEDPRRTYIIIIDVKLDEKNTPREYLRSMRVLSDDEIIDLQRKEHEKQGVLI